MTETVTDTKHSNALVAVQTTTPDLIASLDRYARSAGDWYGDLLKFNGKDGKWTAGPQGTEIAIGTELVAIVSAMLVGFVRWEDGELVGEEMVPLTEDYDPKVLRASLGDTDRTLWPPGEDGQAQNPWREACKLPMKRSDDRRRVHVLNVERREGLAASSAWSAHTAGRLKPRRRPRRGTSSSSPWARPAISTATASGGRSIIPSLKGLTGCTQAASPTR